MSCDWTHMGHAQATAWDTMLFGLRKPPMLIVDVICNTPAADIVL